jgi:hypothetical protein
MIQMDLAAIRDPEDANGNVTGNRCRAICNRSMRGYS